MDQKVEISGPHSGSIPREHLSEKPKIIFQPSFTLLRPPTTTGSGAAPRFYYITKSEGNPSSSHTRPHFGAPAVTPPDDAVDMGEVSKYYMSINIDKLNDYHEVFNIISNRRPWKEYRKKMTKGSRMGNDSTVLSDKVKYWMERSLEVDGKIWFFPKDRDGIHVMEKLGLLIGGPSRSHTFPHIGVPAVPPPDDNAVNANIHEPVNDPYDVLRKSDHQARKEYIGEILKRLGMDNDSIDMVWYLIERLLEVDGKTGSFPKDRDGDHIMEKLEHFIGGLSSSHFGVQDGVQAGTAPDDAVHITILEQLNNPQAFKEFIKEIMKESRMENDSILLREMVLPLLVQAAGAVISQTLMSASSSKWTFYSTEATLVLGMVFAGAGIHFRRRKQFLSYVMSKFAAMAAALSVVISLGSLLPTVTAWSVGTITCSMVAIALAIA